MIELHADLIIINFCETWSEKILLNHMFNIDLIIQFLLL